ncbi:MAG: L-serine ammonia-lyase [Oligoflexales bacterium]
MAVSLFDLFKIGIGPSSSHTVGPMLAAFTFAQELKQAKYISKAKRILVDLYGSLALTGIGHGTDRAIILGLAGYEPDGIDPNLVFSIPDMVKQKEVLKILGVQKVAFHTKNDIAFHRTKTLKHHPNGLKLTCFDKQSKVLNSKTFYSIGGGFIATEEELNNKELTHQATQILPYPFTSGRDLLELSEKQQMSISNIVLANEMALRPREVVENKLDNIWNEMNQCIDRGCKTKGVLPGSLKVKRRAGEIFEELTGKPEHSLKDPLTILDWVNLYALAVNEENAAGSRVVTAPTNGASGIIPAILRYYERLCHHQGDRQGIHKILLTATAIGSLYAKNASISGAEVGCQGEVGVACSMAAGGLTAALGGNTLQIEQAAEIAMEHNLGLTCDPIGGLVQIPCIERNAMGAVKAINATRIALRGNGHHFVSLDSVIKTMKETGKDMKTKYKETSRGGLAVNVPLC